MSLSFRVKLPSWLLIPLLTVCLYTTAISEQLEYSDLQIMAVNCFPRDTCSQPVQLPFENRTCECDRLCKRFKDCCIDAPVSRRSNVPRRAQALECIEIELDTVYAVAMCPATYQGSDDIRSKCETVDDISDPPAMAPTTDIVFNITYKNHYCAQCNDADTRNLRSWEIIIDCNQLPDNSSNPVVNSSYVDDHLIFVSTEGSNGSWGFNYPENSNQFSDERSQFYACGFRFGIPDLLRPFIRFCRPDLISSCAVSWTRNPIRSTCQSYMAVVYVGNKFYRNPHCALCNFELLESLRCPIPDPNVDRREMKPALSFTMLMDVNMSDGNRVGETRDDRCPNNKQWDKFAKRCRSSGCAIPGYRKQNGACVPP